MEDKAKTAVASVIETQNKLGDVYLALKCMDGMDYDSVINRLTPTEAAKMHVAMAYSVASLYYVLQRSKV